MVVTSLYDSVAMRFAGLVINFNCEAAIRDFKNDIASAYGDTGNRLFTNPSDYDLYYLADFDAELGKITPINPTVIAKAKQIYDLIDREVDDYGYEENR